jgi:tetratricopeptide (TPR) repeat protein
MLLVSGEPGIGKTRLVRELCTEVQVAGDRVLVGECYAESGAPYAPFAQILRRAFRDGAGDELAAALPDFVLADLLTLAPSLRLRFPDVPPNPSLDPKSERQRLFENVVACCQALCEAAPVLLVLEDAHWADSGSLALLRHLARRTRRHRLLIMATYREVELDQTRPFQEILLDLNRERLATRLRLKRLDREGTHDMLTVLFAEEIMPELLRPEFVDGVYTETEGNPFFVEEVCKALVESGQVTFAEGTWDRPGMEDLQIPQSVRVAIQSRVSKLPADCQEMLRLAAILGREFAFETLLEASQVGEEGLIEALECAGRAQLVEEVSAEQDVTFAFTHALIPTTLAEGVSTLRRRRLHRRAAAAIAQLHPDDLESLAYHYSEAGDEERALAYHVQAGARASAAFANVEAEEHYRAALELVETVPERADLLWELGRALNRQSKYEEALEVWQKGIDQYQALGNRDGVARLYARSARAAWLLGDTPRGLTICREGMAAAGDAPESEDQADLLHETARACHFNGLPDEAAPLCRQALEMAERLGAIRVRVEALTTLGVLPSVPYEESIAVLTRAIELAESAGLLDQAGRAHNNLGSALIDPEVSREHFVRAAELDRQRGEVVGEFFCAFNAADCSLALGDLAAVEEAFSSLRQLADTIKDPGTIITMRLRGLEPILLRYRGELAAGIDGMQSVRDEARSVGDLQTLAELSAQLIFVYLSEGLGNEEEIGATLRELVSLGDRGMGTGVLAQCMQGVRLARQGDFETARRLVAAARGEATELGDLARWEAHLSWSEAQVALEEGQWPEALAAFEAAFDALVFMKARWYLARVRIDWAEAHLARGEPGDQERAGELFRETEAEFVAMGAHGYVERVRGRLEELG